MQKGEADIKKNGYQNETDLKAEWFSRTLFCGETGKVRKGTLAKIIRGGVK